MYENNFRIEGTIHDRFDALQVTETFRKREFILSVLRPGDSMVVDKLKFQCVQSNIILLDNVRVGNRVIVSFRLTGREWNSDEGKRYFTNLDCVDIDILDATNLEEHTPDSMLAKDIKSEIIPADGFTAAEEPKTDEEWLDKKIDDEFSDLPF
jgi:hypothetical protein